MPQPSELASCLKALHLSLAAECYPEIAEEARREQLSHEQFLLALMGRELEQRRENRTGRWLHESRLPLEKGLAGFDRTRLPAKVAAALNTLLEESSLRERRMCWPSEIREAARLTCCAPWHRS